MHIARSVLFHIFITQLVIDDEATVGEECSYAERIEGIVCPIICKLCADCEDRGLWHKVQKSIFKTYLQSGHAGTRLAALACIKKIYTDVGQEYAAACVPEALQTLSEALDDSDASVSKKAVEIIKLMSQLTGEDVASYIK